MRTALYLALIITVYGSSSFAQESGEATQSPPSQTITQPKEVERFEASAFRCFEAKENGYAKEKKGAPPPMALQEDWIDLCVNP